MIKDARTRGNRDPRRPHLHDLRLPAQDQEQVQGATGPSGQGALQRQDQGCVANKEALCLSRSQLSHRGQGLAGADEALYGKAWGKISWDQKNLYWDSVFKPFKMIITIIKVLI